MPIIDKATASLRKSPVGYELTKEPWSGFKTAVSNGQTRLALEYAVLLIGELRAEVQTLKGSTVEELPLAIETEKREPVEPVAKQPRQKKPKEEASDVTAGSAEES